MTKPPIARKPVSQEFLNHAFNDGHWAEKLCTYREVKFYHRPTPPEAHQPLGTDTIGIKYYDPEGNLAAIVFYYKKPDGSLGASGQPSPKGLLIGGIWHYR